MKKKLFVVMTEDTSGAEIELITPNEEIAIKRCNEIIVLEGRQLDEANKDEWPEDYAEINGAFYATHDSYDCLIAWVESHWVEL